MSCQYIGWAWSQDLDTTAKLLLLYLADNADCLGQSPARSTKILSKIVSRNSKTTLRALHSLEAAHLITRENKHFFRLRPTTVKVALDAIPEPEAQSISDPKPVVAAPAKPEPIETTPQERRLMDFCVAWGLTVPSAALAAAWQALETAEAKYNRKEKHSDGPDKWINTIESLDETLPQILHAIAVFQHRATEGLGNHADSPVEFVNKALWLAPEYQVSLTAPAPEDEKTIDELDDMVMKMNRHGGPFATHLRVSGKNPHTGEIETETDAVYRKRVLGKWNQYLASAGLFME